MNTCVQTLRNRKIKDLSGSYALPIEGGECFAYVDPKAGMVEGSANDGEMSIEFVVITDEVDREGDVIEPCAVEEYLAEYRANPIWLLEHNPIEPIGLARDKSGHVHLRIEPHQIVAKCFYNRLPLRGVRLSEEIYRLTKEGVFAGASPGFLPVEMTRRGYSKSEGYLYSKIRLTELSATCQPVNQQALRRSLSRGIIKSLTLKRRLESMLVKPAPVVNGATLETKSMSKPKIGAIEFDLDIYTPTEAERFLAVKGYSNFGEVTELPGAVIFGRKSIKLIPGSKQTLGKGVVALLGKAIKEGEEDEEEASDTPDSGSEEDTEEIPLDEAAEDTEAADDYSGEEIDESAETPEEETAESPSEQAVEGEDANAAADADSLKQVQDLVSTIVHFEGLLEALPALKTHPALAQTFAEIKQTSEGIVQKLNDAFKEFHAGHALELMKQQIAGPAEDVPAATPSEDAALDENPNPDETLPDGSVVAEIDDETPDLEEDKIEKAKSIKAQRAFTEALKKCLNNNVKSAKKLSSVC